MGIYHINEIKNESDVEQKFILPLLTSIFPLGFGYSLCDFRTKTDLKQFFHAYAATECDMRIGDIKGKDERTP